MLVVLWLVEFPENHTLIFIIIIIIIVSKILRLIIITTIINTVELSSGESEDPVRLYGIQYVVLQ